ncbi:MAG: alpha/beta hydrolase, partial [Lachnospiraceae bacterium]|nr:alpha/beta hydrolase [Lachnospiraceae bacterium]
VLSIFGSEDGVLNMDKVAEGRALVCGEYKELVIEGGNHARFGSYGEQAGDGKATISAAEQWQRTVEFILNNK